VEVVVVVAVAAVAAVADVIIQLKRVCLCVVSSWKATDGGSTSMQLKRKGQPQDKFSSISAIG